MNWVQALAIFGLFLLIGSYQLFRQWFPIWPKQKTRQIAVANLLVDSPSCHLPDLPLFDPQTEPLFLNFTDQRYQCPQKYSNHPRNQIEIKRVNFTSILLRFPDEEHQWRCWIAELGYDPVKDKTDYKIPFKSHIERTTLVQLRRNTTMNQSRWNAAVVKCIRGDIIFSTKTSAREFTEIVPLIQDNFPKNYIPENRTKVERSNEMVEENFEQNDNVTDGRMTNSSTESRQSNKPNVLLLGLDSVSRLNFMRYLTKTLQFLNKTQFFELKGHHKVDENTFPNLFAILTGNHYRRFHNFTDGERMEMGQIPLLFGNYSANGYATTFVEDMPTYGIFNYISKIAMVPTDYYLRPVNQALWNLLDKKRTCYRGETEVKYYLDYLLDLLERFRMESVNGLRHFTMVHLSTLTHDNFTNAAYADQLYLDFLEQFFAQNYHHNTYVIFFSDHGIRFGDITYTRSGQYEQRLPFLYVYVPEEASLSDLGPELLRKQLLGNQNRLTSMLDLHATLLHLLTDDVEIANSGPFGRSLFGEIPADRTCDEAGIGPHYCMCNQMESITEFTDHHWNLAQSLVAYINYRLLPYRSTCAKRSLESILSIVRKHPIPSDQSQSLYLIQIQATPQKAIFEATISVKEEPPSSINTSVPTAAVNLVPSDSIRPSVNIVGPISRLNRYGDESYCLAEEYHVIKTFCFCKT